MAKNPDTLNMLRPDLPTLDRPVLLAGPTASGKSALALGIAQAQGRVIINADALQVHDTWQILTARPTASEMAGIPHYLYGCVSRGQDWSVGHWLRAVSVLLDMHPNPVIIGGTGLYFRALTEGLVEIPPIPPGIRQESNTMLATEGREALLQQLDAPTRARIDTANPARVQRAWEVLRATGQGLAAWQEATPAPRLPLARTTPVILRPQVERLNARIDSRFEAMMAAGALDEARAALPHWDPRAPWAKAIGAPELIAHLQGQITLAQAMADATRATRQYAKRQRTWFRNRMADWWTLD